MVHGGDIYRNPGVLDFSSNCNCFGMPEAVKEAALSGVQSAAVYPDPEYEQLREAIAEYEQMDAWQILCGNGASELLLAFISALHPKRALLAAPCFLEYERVLDNVGAEIEWYEGIREGFCRLDQSFLQLLEHTNAELVILCNPNNPTGSLIRPEDLEQIIEITKKRRITLLMDECFIDFLEDPDRFSAKRYLWDNPYLAVLKAFTKTFACAGLRIGYLMASDQDLLCNCKKHLPEWNVSVPATYGGIAAAKEREWLSITSGEIRKEREWMRKRLEEQGYQVYPGEANFLFFTGKEGLYEHCLRHHILIRDCSNYHGLDKGAYRICVRNRGENERLLAVLKEV